MASKVFNLKMSVDLLFHKYDINEAKIWKKYWEEAKGLVKPTQQTQGKRSSHSSVLTEYLLGPQYISQVGKRKSSLTEKASEA